MFGNTVNNTFQKYFSIENILFFLYFIFFMLVYQNHKLFFEKSI